MTDFKEMSENERNEMCDILCSLFKNGFICKNIIEAKTGLQKKNPKYDQCRILEENLSVYLSILHIELNHEQDRGIYYLKSESTRGPALSPETTYLLVLLRHLYDEKMQSASIGNPWTTLKEIRTKGMDSGLITENLGKKLLEAIRILKRKNIITFPGYLTQMDDDTPIYILETILIAASTDRMRLVCENHDNKEKEEEENDGTSDLEDESSDHE